MELINFNIARAVVTRAVVTRACHEGTEQHGENIRALTEPEWIVYKQMTWFLDEVQVFAAAALKRTK